VWKDSEETLFGALTQPFVASRVAAGCVLPLDDCLSGGIWPSRYGRRFVIRFDLEPEMIDRGFDSPEEMAKSTLGSFSIHFAQPVLMTAGWVPKDLLANMGPDADEIAAEVGRTFATVFVRAPKR